MRLAFEGPAIVQNVFENRPFFLSLWFMFMTFERLLFYSRDLFELCRRFSSSSRRCQSGECYLEEIKNEKHAWAQEDKWPVFNKVSGGADGLRHPKQPVQLNGKTYHPGQGNNLYIFPGLGLGACTIGAAKISDSMVLVSAETLASMVSVCGLPYFRWTFDASFCRF
jgi:hypothetical protein